jgi:methylenetetrahydrofolate reductase (NADPH)
MANRTRSQPDGVRSLLEHPRYEVMPFDSFDEQITHLPDGATITITASPQLGIERTIEKSLMAAEAGFEVVPHVSARYVRDGDHIAEITETLQDAGIDDIFVPGGDREEPIGEFDSAYQMLATMDELGLAFDDVGITGYPEGHPFISNETLGSEMAKKAPHATYIATQLCYDAETILDWIGLIRDDRDIDLPVQVGIPGVMKYQRLLSISRQVGVGDSVKFLQKTTGIIDFVKQFIGSRGKYAPDDLIEGLAAHVDDERYDIAGVHIYTFNQVPDTEEWRTDVLATHQ